MKFFLLGIIFLTACSSAEVGVIPRKAPSIILFDSQGDTFGVSQVKGKKTVLLFFAQWCSASRRLLENLGPYLESNPNGKANLVLVSIDRENDFDKTKELLAKDHLDHLQLAFSGNGVMDQAYLALDGEVIPSFYVFENGTIIDGGHSLGVLKRHW